MPTVTSRRRALTLVELMVAIAVMAVVVGLLIPGIQIVRHAAIRTQCCNNLHNLGLAFRHWKDVNDPKTFPTTSWVSELSRYVENTKGMFQCPLDTLSTGADDTKMSISLFIDSRATPLQIFELNNTNNVPIEKAGPRCRNSTRYALPASSPPGSWMAEFEITWNTNNWSSGGALDWDDLFLLLEPQTNGTWKVSYFASDPHGGVGGNELFDILDENKNPIASDVRPGQYGFVPGNGRGISYGMNSRAHNLELDNSKILLFEYGNTVARVVPPAPYNSELSFFPTYVAPRHAGVLNVLYADGHIETHTSSEIDPRDGRISPISWVP